MNHDEETARRNYWTSQLDDAHAFMMRAADCPIAECGERLVSLADAADNAGVEVAFSDRPHVHGLPRIFMLREGQIAAFVDAASRLTPAAGSCAWKTATELEPCRKMSA